MTAKEMFEQLGYKCVLEINKHNLECVQISYEWQKDKYAKIKIIFFNDCFYANLYQYDFEQEKLVRVGGCSLNKDVFKAIHKQIEELGWLDE